MTPLTNLAVQQRAQSIARPRLNAAGVSVKAHESAYALRGRQGEVAMSHGWSCPYTYPQPDPYPYP